MATQPKPTYWYGRTHIDDAHGHAIYQFRSNI